VTPKPLRVYVDTSVIGGCIDEEFAADSKRVFELALKNRLILLLSEVVVAEIEPHLLRVREILDALPPRCTQRVPITPDVVALGDAYVRRGCSVHVGRMTLRTLPRRRSHELMPSFPGSGVSTTKPSI